MMPYLLLLVLSTSNAIRLQDHHEISRDTRVIDTPHPTLFKDIDDSELKQEDGEYVKHIDYNVSIMVYTMNEGISREMREHGAWDRDSVKALCDAYIQHGSKGNFLDIGGNLGTYAIPLARCIQDANEKSKYLVIEAFKLNAQKLRASIKYNRLDNIHLYEYAVSDPSMPDELEMEGRSNNNGVAHLVGHDIQSKKKVMDEHAKTQVTTIDAIRKVEDPLKIFALKMDIEGHEPSAFEGATKFLDDSSTNGPCVIWIELAKRPPTLLALLQKHDYVVKYQETTGDRNAWLEKSDMDACVKNIE